MSELLNNLREEMSMTKRLELVYQDDEKKSRHYRDKASSINATIHKLLELSDTNTIDDLRIIVDQLEIDPVGNVAQINNALETIHMLTERLEP